MSSYLYNCPVHGEVVLDLKLGTAKEIEKCPKCDADVIRVYSPIGNIWKTDGDYGKSK